MRLFINAKVCLDISESDLDNMNWSWTFTLLFSICLLAQLGD